MKQLLTQLFVAVILLVVFLMGVDRFIRTFIPLYNEKTIEQLQSLTPESKSIIFVGTSRTQCAVLSDSLAKVYPNHTLINAGIPGIGFFQMEFVLRFLNSLPGKKMFVLELMPDIRMENPALMFLIHKLNIPHGYASLAKINHQPSHPLFLFYWKLKSFMSWQFTQLFMLQHWLELQFGFNRNRIDTCYIGYQYTELNTYRSLETLLNKTRLDSVSNKTVNDSLKQAVHGLIRSENDSTRYVFVLPYITHLPDEYVITVPVFNSLDSAHAWHFSEADFASFRNPNYLMNANHFNYTGAKVYTAWVKRRLEDCSFLP
ncbi:MAG: hypothetical protein ACR2IL_08775 [Chitinophagaceae bacterium]